MSACYLFINKNSLLHLVWFVHHGAACTDAQGQVGVHSWLGGKGAFVRFGGSGRRPCFFSFRSCFIDPACPSWSWLCEWVCVPTVWAAAGARQRVVSAGARLSPARVPRYFINLIPHFRVQCCSRSRTPRCRATDAGSLLKIILHMTAACCWPAGRAPN